LSQSFVRSPVSSGIPFINEALSPYVLEHAHIIIVVTTFTADFVSQITVFAKLKPSQGEKSRYVQRIFASSPYQHGAGKSVAASIWGALKLLQSTRFNGWCFVAVCGIKCTCQMIP
jgi:hypothetical protein